MPDVSLINEHNQTYSILSTTADLTIMIFWSQSCAPCLREMKSLEALYPKAKKDNINVMIVSPASNWRNSKEERLFLTKYGAPTLPFYNDVKNKLSLSLGIGTTPYTIIMDKNGKKIATIQGEADWSSKKLYKMIKKLASN
jgi:peroxiredoxin